MAVSLLEPFQHEIAREVFSDRRELLVMLPRSCGKTTLLAAVGLFALLSARDPAIYVGAASRDQARLLFEQAKRRCAAIQTSRPHRVAPLRAARQQRLPEGVRERRAVGARPDAQPRPLR